MVTKLLVKIRETSLHQYVIAEKCGLAEYRLSRIANGHAKPRPAEVAALAKFFRCEESELFPER